jgi:ABC-type microcin C transport system duplicated ATPase subunit YejF
MTEDLKKTQLQMEIYKKELQNAYQQLAKSSDGQRVIAHLIEDLFIFGNTPEQQARANKAREILVSIGLLDYTAKGIPTWESLLKLTQQLFQNRK